MKKHILLFAIAAALAACNNTVDKAKADAKEPDAQVAAASDTKMDYAYTIEHPDNWVTGSRENTKMVLQSLKDYENGNFAAALTPFADSIKLSFDYVNGIFTKDSAMKMFTQERSKIKSLKIDMEDFESVKSRD